jgi:DNA-binding CsgD family transcriptional regulator
MSRSRSAHVYRYSPRRTVHSKPDPAIAIMALEALCNAFPTGAVALDSRCHFVFSNREGLTLLQRWLGHRMPPKIRRSSQIEIPQEFIAACERLKGSKGDSSHSRPRFGGRVFLRHSRNQHLSAVVALERSPRDRSVAIFCILIQDRLKENLVGGRKDQLAMLTMAERRVAKLVAEGLRNHEIADALGKSVTTVKTQVSAAFAKLQIRTRTQLATLLRAV